MVGEELMLGEEGMGGFFEGDKAVSVDEWFCRLDRFWVCGFGENEMECVEELEILRDLLCVLRGMVGEDGENGLDLVFLFYFGVVKGVVHM